MDYIQIQQQNKIIRRIGRIKNPFSPEEVTAKYLILFIDVIGVYKGRDEKSKFIGHLIDNHLPTIETPGEFKRRMMNEHVWINSHLSRLAGEYAIAVLGVGRQGTRMVGRTVIDRHFLQMAIIEALGFRFVYQSIARLNKNFNSVVELEYDQKLSRPGLAVIRKRTKKHYLDRLTKDLGDDLVNEALEMDDQMTKGVLESIPKVVSVTSDPGKITEPYCELRGDDFCEYHIQLQEEKRGLFKAIKGLMISTFVSLLFIVPMVRKMGEQLAAMELAIQKQTRDLSDSQIRLEEKVRQRTQELRKLNAHLVMTEERERKNMADNLHEGLAQELAMSRILISQLASEPDAESSPKIIEKLGHYMDGMIAKTRDMTNDLSPPVLHELGLEAALVWLVEKMEQEHPIRVELDINQEGQPLSADSRILIFRVAQELFVNIIKHARADRVSVIFAGTRERVQLIIEDNGVGFDPGLLETFGNPESAGYGLYSIRDRVRFSGGRFDLEAEPGNGCRACLTLPYPL